MTSRRSVMIVSERLDPERRARMANGIEPRTEGLLLEREHGVELHDWSRLGSGRVRSPGLATLAQSRPAPIGTTPSSRTVSTSASHLHWPNVPSAFERAIL